MVGRDHPPDTFAGIATYSRRSREPGAVNRNR
jgi:hypothetical protein